MKRTAELLCRHGVRKILQCSDGALRRHAPQRSHDPLVEVVLVQQPLRPHSLVRTEAFQGHHMHQRSRLRLCAAKWKSLTATNPSHCNRQFRYPFTMVQKQGG